MKIRSRQAGYLMEVPLLMAAVGVVLAILYPRLPGPVAKVALVAAGLVWIVGSYYMVVTPGWLPGDAHRMNRRLRLAGWFVIVLTISLVVGVVITQA